MENKKVSRICKATINSENNKPSLILIADRILELIYLKYLKATISYEKEIRIETYPFPHDGIREAVFNALIHCNWADSILIQIRIEDDAMYISNCCILPSSWTTETLMERHKSRPYNPDIANTFFRAGYVETWGRGIQKICEACQKHGIPEPKYSVLGGDITVKFVALQSSRALKLRNDVLKHLAIEVNVGIEEYTRLIEFMDVPRTRKELQEFLGYKSRNYLKDKILNPLIAAGKIDLTVLDKPKSPKQKYIWNKNQ